MVQIPINFSYVVNRTPEKTELLDDICILQLCMCMCSNTIPQPNWPSCFLGFASPHHSINDHV